MCFIIWSLICQIIKKICDHNINIPHQLFKQHPALQNANIIYLVEEWLFFKQYAFHKQKLILHRASMRFYKEWLEKKGYEVVYVECDEIYSDIRKLVPHLKKNKVSQIDYAEVNDDWLQKRLISSCKQAGIELSVYKTPQFLNSAEDVATYFEQRQKYFQTDFYIQQRKDRKILVDKDKLPEGSKWSFDTENRSKLPKNEKLPLYRFPKESKSVKKAKKRIKQHFRKN